MCAANWSWAWPPSSLKRNMLVIYGRINPGSVLIWISPIISTYGTQMIQDDQQAVIDFLGRPQSHGGAPVARIVTHAAMVFLAGAPPWLCGRPRKSITACWSSWIICVPKVEMIGLSQINTLPGLLRTYMTNIFRFSDDGGQAHDQFAAHIQAHPAQPRPLQGVPRRIGPARLRIRRPARRQGPHRHHSLAQGSRTLPRTPVLGRRRRRDRLPGAQAGRPRACALGIRL